jgi:hypothetical protein
MLKLHKKAFGFTRQIVKVLVTAILVWRQWKKKNVTGGHFLIALLSLYTYLIT